MDECKKKILVIRHRFIGDTVLLIPFLRNLRNLEPDAQIDVTITTTTYPILKNCPYVDNFIFIDSNKQKHTYETKIKPQDFKKIIKNNHYTHTYILKRSFSAAWLAFCCGIKNRIGFDTECRGFLLTSRIKYNKKIHEVQSFLDVLRSENRKVDDGFLELFKDKDDIAFVDKLLSEQNFDKCNFVILHATSGNKLKQWKLENWYDIIKYLANDKKYKIIFLGADVDKKIYEEILEKTGSLDVAPLNLCGKLSLGQSMEVISRAKLIVGCDSGNLHIASAFKIPVIGIYGPMSTVKWGAIGKQNTILQGDEECCPCSLKKKCKNDYKCLSDITSDMVLKTIKKYNI